MAKMMTSPSTIPAVNVLASQIALMVGALRGRENTRWGATESTEEMVPSLGSVGTYVEVSTAPRSQPIDFIAVARMCAIIV
jgi:hypothetical protein